MVMPWGRFFHPTDARGRESRTLWFVTVSWLVMTVRFIAGGMEFTIGPVHWAIAPSLVLDYGGAVAAVIAVWVGREWVTRRTQDV